MVYISMHLLIRAREDVQNVEVGKYAFLFRKLEVLGELRAPPKIVCELNSSDLPEITDRFCMRMEYRLDQRSHVHPGSTRWGTAMSVAAVFFMLRAPCIES
jgi:hypothetical protein